MLLVRVATAVLTLKPTSVLFQAVLRRRMKLPGWELSVKPLAALEKAMQFVMLWFAAYMGKSVNYERWVSGVWRARMRIAR